MRSSARSGSWFEGKQPASIVFGNPPAVAPPDGQFSQAAVVPAGTALLFVSGQAQWAALPLVGVAVRRGYASRPSLHAAARSAVLQIVARRPAALAEARL